MSNKYKLMRKQISLYANSYETSTQLLAVAGIDFTRAGFFKVRENERTPSCKINRDGSFHDFGSGEHYSDVISLFYDGYQAFSSLYETMKWVSDVLNINIEVDND